MPIGPYKGTLFYSTCTTGFSPLCEPDLDSSGKAVVHKGGGPADVGHELSCAVLHVAVAVVERHTIALRLSKTISTTVGCMLCLLTGAI